MGSLLRSPYTRQFDPAGAALEIAFVLSANSLEMSSEIGFHDHWKHRHAVLVALASADHDLAPGEVDV
jgi:hypothetical protein